MFCGFPGFLAFDENEIGFGGNIVQIAPGRPSGVPFLGHSGSPDLHLLLHCSPRLRFHGIPDFRKMKIDFGERLSESILGSPETEPFYPARVWTCWAFSCTFGNQENQIRCTSNARIARRGIRPVPQPPISVFRCVKTKVSCESQNVKKKWHHFFEIRCLPYTGPL